MPENGAGLVLWLAGYCNCQVKKDNQGKSNMNHCSC